MRKKPKKKQKGKKIYKNTHGTRYRVRLGYRHRLEIQRREMLRALSGQKT